MKILLHESFLNLRGTSVALYDYAFYLKDIGHECVITHDNTSPKNVPTVINKFQTEFEIIPYNTFSEINNIIKSNQVDVLYTIKSGENDGKISTEAKCCVHAVFPHDINEAHGDVYAYVSEWLSNHCSGGKLPYVPHMVNLPDNDNQNFRKQLNIPDDSIVFGRYGGPETFDIPFVYQAIKQILEQTSNIFFLFCNTHCFIDHPRVIFTNNTASLHEKVKFINTCDAFLHARFQGETFGLSILEFMSKNKPVFTFGQSPEKHHYSLLDGQGHIYNNQDELLEMLKKFTPTTIHYKQLCNFLPQPVIKQFCSVFLT